MREVTLETAISAYNYGYPLLYNLDEIEKLLQGKVALAPGAGEIGVFGHSRELASPDQEFVTPNNDTLYSIAVVDVRSGPVMLQVPATDRYYVLQFVDAWTNNFAYVGTRSTGGDAGSYRIVASEDDRDPAGNTIVAPTGLFVIVGRVAVAGADDLVAARTFQDALQLDLPEQPPIGLPQIDPASDPELVFWERLRVSIAAFPPSSGEREILAGYRATGILDADSPNVDPDPEFRRTLLQAQRDGADRLEQLIKSADFAVNGWTVGTHVFDYNLDHHEFGTIDTDEWRFGDRNFSHIARSAAARVGLWGNHGYEAVYAQVFLDENGEPLHGSHRYELHLEEPPPVKAFWSLTMYDADRFYLVANPIGRYSIGDRTPGLVYGDDGSLTLYLQHDPPSEEHVSNWLPAPEGTFRPIMRMYLPEDPVLDRRYQLPAIRRID